MYRYIDKNLVFIKKPKQDNLETTAAEAEKSENGLKLNKGRSEKI